MSEILNDLGQPVGAPVDGWQGAVQPSRRAMQGRFVRLEAVSPEFHAADLYRAFSADEAGRNWTYMRYGPFGSEGQLRDWLQSDCCGGEPLFYAIINHESRAVGLASYLHIAPDNGSIEVGHLSYSPALQRTAAATEAMYLMMRRVFAELGYRRYEWRCDHLNASSRRAAERLGFRFEGIARNATVYKGRSRDTAFFSILDSEWPALQKAYEQWLSPDNFDTRGDQRTALAAMIEDQRKA